MRPAPLRGVAQGSRLALVTDIALVRVHTHTVCKHTLTTSTPRNTRQPHPPPLNTHIRAPPDVTPPLPTPSSAPCTNQPQMCAIMHTLTPNTHTRSGPPLCGWCPLPRLPLCQRQSRR